MVGVLYKPLSVLNTQTWTKKLFNRKAVYTKQSSLIKTLVYGLSSEKFWEKWTSFLFDILFHR